jgi:lysophospholipase L1-like esterase
MLVLVACGKNEDTPCGDMAGPNRADKEDILIIGDSISIGYTPYVQSALSDYDVVHNVCNAQYSENGVAKVDQWLAQRPAWKLITFNHGLWDMGKGVPLNEYADNLRVIGLKLKQAAPTVIFFTTTPCPVNAPCVNHDNDAYNQAAISVMQSIGIQVYDLNGVAVTIPHLMINAQAENDVHYTSEGYFKLGEFVGSSIFGNL